MIRYALCCEAGHAFEAWFRDSAAYDAQRAEGRVACGVCGSDAVEKAPMAPALGAASSGASKAEAGAPTAPGPVAALTALRRHLEATADYVGPRFAAEARRIHDEGGAERPIWGEATTDEARALMRDGVPVAPLPRLPRRND